MKKIISFILVISMMGGIVLAVNSAELSNKLEQSNNNIQKKENQINQVKQQQDSVLDEIEAIDLEINESEKELDKIQEQINGLNNKIKSKEKEIEDAQKKMIEENILLQKRVRAMYENGETGHMKMLLDSENVIDFVKRYEITGQIVEADKRLVEDLTKRSQEIQCQKLELEDDKLVIEIARKQESANKNKLATSRGAKNSRLKLLEKNEKELQKQLDREIAASKAIEEELRALKGKSTVKYDNSAFIWPLPATSKKITCDYGYRTHPVTKKKNSMHTGVDIGNAPTGTNIYAAKSGQVIKAGWNTAYGNMIIIDHGNGISTLYGHSSKLLVSVGQSVKQGEVIAKVGSTGYSTGPHLHFEVRENGTPVSPKKYINY